MAVTIITISLSQKLSNTKCTKLCCYLISYQICISYQIWIWQAWNNQMQLQYIYDDILRNIFIESFHLHKFYVNCLIFNFLQYYVSQMLYDFRIIFTAHEFSRISWKIFYMW